MLSINKLISSLYMFETHIYTNSKFVIKTVNMFTFMINVYVKCDMLWKRKYSFNWPNIYLLIIQIKYLHFDLNTILSLLNNCRLSDFLQSNACIISFWHEHFTKMFLFRLTFSVRRTNCSRAKRM